MLYTSKLPPRRTNGCEQMNITSRMKNSAIPVGFAHPPTRPNKPGLAVNSHSAVVKFFALTIGSFTTIVAVRELLKDCAYLHSSLDWWIDRMVDPRAGVKQKKEQKVVR